MMQSVNAVSRYIVEICILIYTDVLMQVIIKITRYLTTEIGSACNYILLIITGEHTRNLDYMLCWDS